jgi:membrane protein DedA with SNARE-associated domain
MEEVLEFLRNSGGVWPLLLIFAAAALEYMLPFLPGDSVVLAGSLLVVSGVWPFWVVAAAAITGGLLGSASHYALGRMMVAPDGSLRGGRYLARLGGPHALERFFAAFRRWGMWVIALNRMFPGVRGVAFIAAGAARLPAAKTLAFGLLSNIGWSVLILSAGVAVGGNWQKIKEALGVYEWIVALLLVAGALIYAVFRHRRRREV